ncbi:MAG: metal ABC transporter solute-binding protein, Zn/Mn family [Mangrovibacterium sp.]
MLLALGCQPRRTGDKLQIAVSILPQKYFVEKLAGDLVRVHVLVPPGSSPELYALMPSQMKELSASTAWLRIGKIGFEESWAGKIRAGKPGLQIFDTSVQADWIAGEEEHNSRVHRHGTDPHIWLSPAEVRKIVTETHRALLQLLPARKEMLSRNYTDFIREIDALDRELTTLFAPLKNRSFLIFHPALSYLARDYQLEQLALETDGKEPSARHMQQLVRQARARHISVVLIQKEFDTENARQLAREIGGEVVQIDPLSENWTEELRKIARKIAGAQENQEAELKKQTHDKTHRNTRTQR